MITFDEVWEAFLELEKAYPRVLPLTLWRSWELAWYRRYQLPQPVLDLGCGDGVFFCSIWAEPLVADGVDINSQVVQKAKANQVYRDVFVAPAHDLSGINQKYRSIFSNCALEHMDYIDQVLRSSAQVLRKKGKFLFSVVTDKLVEWQMLDPFLSTLGAAAQGEALWNSYVDFHHLVNPLSKEAWLDKLTQAGFRVLDAWPIVPEPWARIFLLLDELWHVTPADAEGEVGIRLRQYFQNMQRYESGLYYILRGLWELEPPSQDGDGAGLVVWAERR